MNSVKLNQLKLCKKDDLNKRISTILQNARGKAECKGEGRMQGGRGGQDYCWRGDYMKKRWSIFGGGLEFLEIAIIDFTSQLLFDLLCFQLISFY